MHPDSPPAPKLRYLGGCSTTKRPRRASTAPSSRSAASGRVTSRRPLPLPTLSPTATRSPCQSKTRARGLDRTTGPTAGTQGEKLRWMHEQQLIKDFRAFSTHKPPVRRAA